MASVPPAWQPCGAHPGQQRPACLCRSGCSACARHFWCKNGWLSGTRRHGANSEAASGASALFGSCCAQAATACRALHHGEGVHGQPSPAGRTHPPPETATPHDGRCGMWPDRRRQHSRPARHVSALQSRTTATLSQGESLPGSRRIFAFARLPLTRSSQIS